MSIKRGVQRLHPGQKGIATEDITKDKFGTAMFEKVPGSSEYFMFEVKAIEDITKDREIWVVDENNGVTEFPGRTAPMAITEAYVYNDYKEISFTATEQSYTIGTAAHEADSSLPLSFEARSELFYATQPCYVRFGEDSRVQHYIPSGVWLGYGQRTKKLYVVRAAGVDGTLKVSSEG